MLYFNKFRKVPLGKVPPERKPPRKISIIVFTNFGNFFRQGIISENYVETIKNFYEQKYNLPSVNFAVQGFSNTIQYVVRSNRDRSGTLPWHDRIVVSDTTLVLHILKIQFYECKSLLWKHSQHVLWKFSWKITYWKSSMIRLTMVQKFFPIWKAVS